MGWKSHHSSVESQVATALRNDNGVDSASSCRSDCIVETTDAALTALAGYVRKIGDPERRPLPDLAGQHLFGQVGCSECPVSVLLTAESEETWKAEQTLWPYSDLLLHDMGEALESRQAFSDLPKTQRDALLTYVRAL